MPNILDEAFAYSHIAWFWGICAESTRDKGQRELEIYVPDLTPLRNGDVKNKGSFTKSNLFNVVTQSWEEYEVNASKTIRAEYLGYESSREVPDMYKGQQVIVMCYGRNDRWFWIPTERDDYAKTFEHVKFRAADIALIHKTGKVLKEDEERVKGLTDDNTYFLELDTKYKKHVLISTSGTDGEKYRYFIKIDAKQHTMELWDCLTDQDSPEKKCKDVPHNTIKIESDPTYNHGVLKGRITLQNEAGATLFLEDQDIKIIAPRDITMYAGNRFIARSVGDTGLTVDGNLHLLTKKDMHKTVKGETHDTFDKGYFGWWKDERTEEVAKTYHRYVTMDLDFKCLNATSIVLGTYTVTATGAASITSTSNMTIAGNNTIITGTYSLNFTGKSIKTSSHIQGCCGCPGH